MQEALSGLKSSPKTISPKFFYDEAGSRLFDQICQTPEYYPTRTEAGIIRDNLQEIAHCARKDCLIVEPGSGNSAKVRELLPEVAELAGDRHRLPAIRSLNFVIHGLLEEGVAASTRQDAQAKSLGEWLRARVVDLPEALLP